MKNWIIGLRIFIALSVVTGIAYPLLMLGIGKIAFPEQVRGSLISKNNVVVGSELLAQKFQKKSYFWARPMEVSNMSVENENLLKAIQDRKTQGATKDLLYASGSGLDPHISPGAANDQIERIVEERKLTPTQRDLVAGLVKEYTESRQWGFLGEPRVNVLKLNLALDEKL